MCMLLDMCHCTLKVKEHVCVFGRRVSRVCACFDVPFQRMLRAAHSQTPAHCVPQLLRMQGGASLVMQDLALVNLCSKVRAVLPQSHCAAIQPCRSWLATTAFIAIARGAHMRTHTHMRAHTRTHARTPTHTHTPLVATDACHQPQAAPQFPVRLHTVGAGAQQVRRTGCR